MKVGDLVELSAAGKKAKQNSEVYGHWGMLVNISRLNQNHPYKIDWYKPDGSIKKVPMARYEIKKLRGAK
tara:strand:- start:379 stop:588 length:210 start_codon:yes stop_codon:yes gene_type:complete